MSELRRTGTLLAVAGALGLGLLTGCGDSSSGSGQAAGAPATSSMSMPFASTAAGSGMAATATEIMIKDFAYKTPDSVAAGSTVSVMNMDDEAHTVTSDQDGAFMVAVPAGKTVTFPAPTTPGSYDFHCDYHADMHGTLVVK